MDDKGILELYWQRREEAIAETDSKYGKLCMEIACKLLHCIRDAQECVNDVYLGLWNTIPPLYPEAFPSYIVKLVRNLSLKRLTYLNAQKRRCVVIPIQELEKSIPDSCNIEDAVMKEELTVAITKFLQVLDYEGRNMFLRRYWFFDSIPEIAQRFHASESKVKSRLFRIRKRLRIFLIKEGLIDDWRDID